MIINSVVAGDWLIARLENAPLAYTSAIAEVMENVSEYLYDRVYDKLSGEALQTRSGRLRDALQHDVAQFQEKYTARVFIDGVPYARIQERGGTTRPHDIVPREASALRFEAAGGVVFAMRVHHPGSRIPESMYMRSVLMRERSTVTAMIKAAIMQVRPA